MVVVSLVLAPAVAACGGDDSGLTGSSSDDDRDAHAYIDAIAATGRYDDPDDDYDILLSGEASVCYGEAYIEVVGVERLAAEVSPQQIEATPEKEATEWDIGVTDAEGADIFRSLVECAPTAMEEVGRSYAEQVGFLFPTVEIDAACLAQADPAAIEDVVGASIARGDDSDPTGEQIGPMIDWLWACGDLRGALLGSLTSELGLHEATTECLDAELDDEAFRDLIVATVDLEDNARPEESPFVAGLMEAIVSCEQLGD